MKKTFPLHIEGRHSDRVMDALKHDLRKYLKRERNRALPEGVDFWDFDCKCGTSVDDAQVVHLGQLFEQVDAVAKSAAKQVYVEILAKHGHRQARSAAPEDL